jgi:hypothetical protein
MKEKIIDLINALEELKTVFIVPKLFISNYFHDLRSRIDLSVIKFNLNNNSLNSDEFLKKINENWMQMIQKLESLEQECYKNCDQMNAFLSKQAKEAIISIKAEICQEKKDFSQIEQLIYDNRFKIEKFLLLNRSVIFIDKENCKMDQIFNDMNTNVTFGRLIIVQNDYYGTKGINYLFK